MRSGQRPCSELLSGTSPTHTQPSPAPGGAPGPPGPATLPLPPARHYRQEVVGPCNAPAIAWRICLPAEPLLPLRVLAAWCAATGRHVLEIGRCSSSLLRKMATRQGKQGVRVGDVLICAASEIIPVGSVSEAFAMVFNKARPLAVGGRQSTTTSRSQTVRCAAPSTNPLRPSKNSPLNTRPSSAAAPPPWPFAAAATPPEVAR